MIARYGNHFLMPNASPSLAERPHPQWPRISSALFYEDAPAAIDWLCRAFGFELRLKIEGEPGVIEHSELEYGGGLIMVGSTGRGAGRAHCASPRSLDDKNTQALCVYVDDIDAHHARAVAAGARIVSAPKIDDYGDEHGANRSYEAVDPEGHHWWFMRIERDPKAS
jgi:uncharacterized glyoxalase superfamily protein PhnB